MIFDKGAESFIKWQQSLVVPDRLMTPDGMFFIQVVGDNEIVYVPKDHPLMTMTDDEFIATMEDSHYDQLAEELYARRQNV